MVEFGDWIQLKEPVPMTINDKEILVSAIRVGNTRPSTVDERAIQMDVQVMPFVEQVDVTFNFNVDK